MEWVKTGLADSWQYALVHPLQAVVLVAVLAACAAVIIPGLVLLGRLVESAWRDMFDGRL